MSNIHQRQTTPFPHSRAEWQDSVNLASAWRVIAQAVLHGNLDGPKIDVARCDRLLGNGRQRGIKPTAAAGNLAVELLQAIAAKVVDPRAESQGSS